MAIISSMQTKTMFALFVLVVQLLSVLRRTDGSGIALLNCSDHCGGVQIPYPFGIGPNCYQNRSYEIICNTTFGHPKAFLRQFDLEVLNITLPGDRGVYDQRLTVALPPLNLCGSNGIKDFHSPDLKGSPYLFSAGSNVLRMEGCERSAVLKDRFGKIRGGCASVCTSKVAANMSGTTCFGVGCCEASIAVHLDFYEITAYFNQGTNSNSCKARVGLTENDYASNRSLSKKWSNSEIFRTTLLWSTPFVLPIPYNAMVNVSCYHSRSIPGFSCSCKDYYVGNPYLPYGCKVVEECRKCESRCQIYYDSTVPPFYYCKKDLLFKKPSFLGFIIGMGVVLLFLGSYWLYRYVKRRKEIKQKAKHFKRNGGMLLQQQMSSDEGVVEKTKIFTVNELEKATDNFNDNRILGQGGQGTVYKGMLMDGKIVAIKKAKKVDESQIEQFVNEVVILSQINHRNVVQVLGCCLETEVPMLVYEYIPNGALYEHLGQREEFHVTWKMRLQIAAESAGAISYLHSSSSAPIYHRDIKSTNILLDEKFRAKVSDFGTSKSISIDQTHVTTVVLGTYGYLDPEYFQSNQYTEKSDVYSFGVVLAELITGKKPICPTENGGWINMACEFLTQLEDSHLLEMVDVRIIDEGKEDEFMAVAELARKCLNMNGKQRPTMKEVAAQLDRIRSSNMPILKEVGPKESIPDVTIYTDGDPFDDLPARSIEIIPLMARGTTF